MELEIEDEYKTVESICQGIYKEKGSKFIAFVHPIDSENDVKGIVDDYKKRLFDARHHCYAYQLGINGDVFRENDDGEPSGTAGKPIHGQIKSFGITNVLIVVVRYFGGVKLGVGGLINAYKQAALDAINQSVIVAKTINSLYNVTFGYFQLNDVMKLVKENDIQVINQTFELSCEMTISLRLSKQNAILEKLQKIEGLTVKH